MVYGQGDIFYRNFGGYKVGFTMLETDGIPAEWVRQANLMDEVWCPSHFNVKTFRNSGVTRPIHAIPLGNRSGVFQPADSDIAGVGTVYVPLGFRVGGTEGARAAAARFQ